MPLHTPTVLASRFPRLGRLAALATVTFATAGAIVVFADGQAVPSHRTVSEPAATRYFDLEANKAASIRALGRHIAEQQANPTTRYDDLEANKARSQRKR